MDYKKLVLKKEEEGDVIEVDENRLLNKEAFKSRIFGISQRIGGEFEDRAFCLEAMCDWVLGKDTDGFLCLIPLKLKVEE